MDFLRINNEFQNLQKKLDNSNRILKELNNYIKKLDKSIEKLENLNKTENDNIHKIINNLLIEMKKECKDNIDNIINKE